MNMRVGFSLKEVILVEIIVSWSFKKFSMLKSDTRFEFLSIKRRYIFVNGYKGLK
jgi:hypothetical protein